MNIQRQAALEHGDGNRDASASGRRPLCGRPIPEAPFRPQHSVCFRCFWWRPGHSVGLLVHFLERGRGASSPRFKEALSPASFPSRGSPCRAWPTSREEEPLRPVPSLGGAPPGSSGKTPEGSVIVRGVRARSMSRKTEGARSPPGLPFT